MSTGSLSWLATRWVAPDSLVAAFAVLASRGHDTGPAKRAGKLPKDFEQTRPRVSFGAAAAVWRHVIRVCHDPALGIHAAEHSLATDPTLIDYLLRTSETLAEGLAGKAKFAPIEDELCHCEWSEDADTYKFVFRGSAEFYLPQVAEFVAARLVGAVRQLSARGQNPVAVRFQHAAPSAVATHRKFFRSVVEFGAPSIEIVYRAAELRLPSATSDPALNRLLLEYAEQKLSDVSRPRGPAERVRELVTQHWQHEQHRIPTRTEVARTLRVTPRTLSRWLEADGKTYSDVIDEFRAMAAARQLQRPEASLGRLAEMLGFKDQSAFTRAFRRWTGMTPGQYRRLHAYLVQ
jgi:AraC-like DNA-binding protein